MSEFLLSRPFPASIRNRIALPRTALLSVLRLATFKSYPLFPLTIQSQLDVITLDTKKKKNKLNIVIVKRFRCFHLELSAVFYRCVAAINICSFFPKKKKKLKKKITELKFNKKKICVANANSLIGCKLKR